MTTVTKAKDAMAGNADEPDADGGDDDINIYGMWQRRRGRVLVNMNALLLRWQRIIGARY